MNLKSYLNTIYSILFLCLLVGAGCKRPKDSQISVDDKQSLGTYYVDTFSATLSTVLIDSLQTSNNNKILVGRYNDPRIGSFSATPYFQFSLAGIDPNNDKRENILSYVEEPVFDSLVLQLTRVYYYGDTTNPHIIKTHRLTEDMRKTGAALYLYANQAFAYDPVELAQNQVRFSHSNGANLRIQLNSLGQEIFDFAKNNDDRVATNEAFKTYFKGLVLVPDAANTCIYGYSRKPVLTLYYHDTNNRDAVKTYTFSHTEILDLNFNQLKNNRAGTLVEPLKEIYQEIDATQTNNESYLLTGVELLSKIKFPYLNAVKAAHPNFAVNKAELIIRPKKNTYNLFYKLPTELVLYKTDVTNIPGSIITYTGTSVSEIVNPIVDYESNIETYYKFEITDFVQDQLKTSFYNGTALMLSSPRSSSGNRTERLVLDNNPSSYNITLKLYLTIF